VFIIFWYGTHPALGPRTEQPKSGIHYIEQIEQRFGKSSALGWFVASGDTSNWVAFAD
jgi:hypothetical protein